MELRKLRHAVALSRYLSFTRAADALNLTQSALTRSIQSLEEECGVRLFDRSKNAVAVTSVGREFLRHAEALLRREDELLDMLNNAASGESGMVAIGMAPLAARTLLAPLMLDLIAAPGFHAQVHIGSQDKLFAMLREEAIDLCVCTSNELPTHALFSSVPLARFPVALVARPGHPLAGKADIRQDDLAAYPLLRSRPFDHEVDEAIGMKRTVQKRPALAVEDYEVLKRLTVSSDAVWITSSIAVREWLLDGTLVEIPISWLETPPQAEMTAYHLKHKTLSPVAERILGEIERLCGKFGDRPGGDMPTQ